MTAFAAAVDLLFADPDLSTPALYQQSGIGVERAVRVMRRNPDRMVEFGAARLVSDSVVLDVRVSDCPELAAGDRFEIAGEISVVQGSPRRDRERLVWTVELLPWWPDPYADLEQ
ncbi:head-tail joining protein [Tabrizicola sp.]|uniref:head-tail joining protein n=1 Tax=Tabrizicola sp. TaxID=2005166 RepID=UPI003D276220